MCSETRSILHKVGANRILGCEPYLLPCTRQIPSGERPKLHLRCLAYRSGVTNRKCRARIHSREQEVGDNCRETIGMILMRKLVTISNCNLRIHCLSPRDQDTTMERETIRLKGRRLLIKLPPRSGLQEHLWITGTVILVAQVLFHLNLHRILSNLNLSDRHEVCNCLTAQRDDGTICDAYIFVWAINWSVLTFRPLAWRSGRGARACIKWRIYIL